MQIEMNNREVIIQGEGILNLIPQRPPIVMVDSFFGIEENHSYSGLTVTADNIFCETRKLQEAGIIEHIAQSAAARIGFLYTRQGEKVPLGFIGSVDKLKIYDLPKIGMKLFTEITVVQEVFDITLISAQVKVEDKLIAECRMKIFIKKNETENESTGCNFDQPDYLQSAVQRNRLHADCMAW